MEIHVSLLDATSAQRLADRLASASETMFVSFDADSMAIRVLTEMESNRAVMKVIDTVDAWLAEAGTGEARLSVDGRSYTMAGPTPVGGEAWL